MHKQYITGFGQISNLGRNANEALKRLLTPKPDHILKLPKGYLEAGTFGHHQLSLPVGTPPIKEEENRAHQIAMITIKEALAHANIDKKSIHNFRIGVCVGTTSACTTCTPQFADNYYRNKVADFQLFEESFLNNPAIALSKYFGFNGPVLTINNACTSGTDTIGIARSWIQQGHCDLVIAGGIDSVLENIYFGFRSLGLISAENSKPFDKDRDGLTLGEASAFVVIESASSISKRKSKPICEVLGYGLATDTFHPTSPHPDAQGLNLAIKSALKDAKKNKDQIDLINAHGTGTPTNDQVEGTYLKKNFDHSSIFATKAYTGHSLGAAGALEAIWGAFCIQENFVPATLGHSQYDPEIGLTPNRSVKDLKVQTYLSTSLGFGGSNSVLILGRPI